MGETEAEDEAVVKAMLEGKGVARIKAKQRRLQLANLHNLHNLLPLHRRRRLERPPRNGGEEVGGEVRVKEAGEVSLKGPLGHLEAEPSVAT